MKLAQTLSAENSKQVLYLHKDMEKTIVAHKNDELIWLTYNDVIQSAITIEPPYRSVLPHNYIMLLPLLYDKEPKSILELGAGALSTQRYLKLTHPSIKMLSIESDEEVLEACNQCFPMSYDLNVKCTDAYLYVSELQAKQKKYDWLMVDLFHGADSPVHESPLSFLQSLISITDDGGWLILNILTKDQAKLNKLGLTLSQLNAGKLYIYAVPEMQNHIFLVSKNRDFCFPAEIEQQNRAVF